MALGNLLTQRDPRAAGQRFTQRTREDVRTRATAEGKSLLIQRLRKEVEEKTRSNPFNQIISGITGFLTGGPVGAIAGALTAPKGAEARPLGAAVGGIGAGGITQQLGTVAGAPSGLITGPATGALRGLVGGQPTTTIPGAAPGITPQVPPTAPPPTFDLGRLVAPEQIGTTIPLLQGLVSGKPFQALLAAKTAQTAAETAKEAKIDKGLERELTRAKLRKFEKEAEKGNFKFEPKTNTILNQDTGEITLGPKQLGQPSIDPKIQFNQEEKLRNSFLKQNVDFVKVRDAARTVATVAKSAPSPAGDLSLIFAYMKLLDPPSTVREGEQATAKSASAVPDRLRDLHNRMLQGTTLTPKQRADFLNRAQQLAKTRKQQFDKTVRIYTDLAESYGLDASRVAIDLSSADPRISSFISQYQARFGKPPSQEILDAFRQKQEVQ